MASEHVSHALARVGDEVDLYYSDPANTLKQAIKVEYNTRFIQNLTNLSQGSSSFLINPVLGGVRHVVLVVGYNASQIDTQTGTRALARGWGYRAVSRISYRIGGSSQYFLTGQQLLARNLRMVRTKSQRDAMLSLGGNECKSATDFDVDQFAYIPLSVFAQPSADGIGLPLPLDLLTSSVQLTVELNPSSVFWSGALSVTVSGVPLVDVAPPSAFGVGYFQAEQILMTDGGMALSNRVDMNSHTYAMPMPEFDQQETVFQTNGLATEQSFLLSGFRSGECKAIQVWLQTPYTSTVSSPATQAQLNPGAWYLPQSISIIYSGVNYAYYQNGSSDIWNLIDSTSPSACEYSLLAQTGTNPMTSTPYLNRYVLLPFAQPSGNDYEAKVLVHGKSVTGSNVNLILTPPDAQVYDVHVVYIYNCTALFSRGSCDLIF